MGKNVKKDFGISLNKVLAFQDLLISTFALLFNGLCVDQAIDSNQEEHQANVQCPMNIP